MDPLRQLNDDGAVIGYRPDLKYTLDKSSGDRAAEQKAVAEQARTEYHSRTYVSFAMNSPSKVATAITEVVSDLEGLIDRLASSFKSGEWSDYNDISSLVAAYQNDNEEYIKKFTEFHRNNLKNGSIKPEVMTQIYYAEKRMKNVLGTIETLYYGQSDIDLNEMYTMDANTLTKLAQLESSDSISNVNYVALANDATFDKMAYDYAINIKRNCTNLADIALEDIEQEDYTTVHRLDIVKKLILEDEEEITYMDSSYNRYHSTEMMNAALYNYYNARSELVGIYDLNDALGSSVLETRICTAQQNMEEALKEVYKAYMGCWNHISNIYTYEKDKRDLLALYGNLLSE